MSNITKSEAMIFAVAIHSILDKVKPMMPSMVIMIVADKVDFKADDLANQVRQEVANLMESDPVVTVPPIGETRRSRIDEAKSYTANCLARMGNKPEPEGQKFPIGTRVRIADDLGKSMSHFRGAGRNATVEHTYAHAFGGDDVKSYFLDVDDVGSNGWYHEHQLTEITDED